MKIDYFERLQELNEKILGLSEGVIYLYICQKINDDNKIETMFYVGQSRRPFCRFYDHLNRVRKAENDACVYFENGTRLRAYVLQKCMAGELNELEEKYISVAEENFGYGLVNYSKTGLKDGYFGARLSCEEKEKFESKIKDCIFDYLGNDATWFAAVDFMSEITSSYDCREMLQKIEVNVAFED